jgi:hypothetical protein
VSPFARPDFVTSTVYDHTSILKLVQQKWNLPSLTRRDAAAESPLDALDLDGEPAFLKPPDLPGPALEWGPLVGRPGAGVALRTREGASAGPFGIMVVEEKIRLIGARPLG